MALCFRRFFKNSILMCSSVRSQHGMILDQQTSKFTASSEMEVTQEYCGPGFQRTNPYLLKTDFLPLQNVCKSVNNKNLLKIDLIHLAEECRAYKEEKAPKESDIFSKPDIGQLEKIHQILGEDLPKFFKKPMNFTIYHEGIVFENNFKGTTTIGLKNYIIQLMLFKLYAAIKYGSVTFQILKITSHIEDGTVRVRWRINGVSHLKVILIMWKNLLTRQKLSKNTDEGWYDGFSIFYVKGDGLVHKHVTNKMMPDDNREMFTVKNPLAAKVALIVGLPSFDLHLHSKQKTDEMLMPPNHCSFS